MGPVVPPSRYPCFPTKMLVFCLRKTAQKRRSALRSATSELVFASLASARMELSAVSKIISLRQLSSPEWQKVVCGNFIAIIEKYRAKTMSEAPGGGMGRVRFHGNSRKFKKINRFSSPARNLEGCSRNFGRILKAKP